MEDSVCISFEDNHLLPLLFGEQDKFIDRIDQELGVTTFSRGSVVSISGDIAQTTFCLLYTSDAADES